MGREEDELYWGIFPSFRVEEEGEVMGRDGEESEMG